MLDFEGKTDIDPFGITMNSNFAPSLYEAPTSKPIGLNFEKILHQGETQDSYLFENDWKVMKEIGKSSRTLICLLTWWKGNLKSLQTLM